MGTWRLLHTWEAAPGFNMALDEALLLARGPAPTLRFYTWRPAALSLGYFQRHCEVRGIERAEAVVRRLTGGGAIHHARELTFSIRVPRGHPPYDGTVADSYARVHRAIAGALAELGVDAGLRGDAPLASDRHGTGMCFHASTPLDLAWGGRKGVGSAQRRKDAGILHHGSIKLGATPMEEGAATLVRAGREVEPEELAGLLCAAFARSFGLRFERAEPSAAELDAAHERAEFFGSDAFVRRR